MREKFSVIVGMMILSTAAVASMPHLDLEMTSAEYQQSLRYQGRTGMTVTASGLEDILQIGNRNLDWLKMINQNRPNKISFSDASTQQGFPLNHPREYNPQIIRAEFNKLKADMPKALSDVIFGQGSFPTQVPTTDQEYIDWGLKTDRVYQIASRWILLSPYIFSLKQRRADDIRGFYYLSQMTDRVQKFNNFKNLTADEQTQIRNWLEQMCLNAHGYNSCKQVVSQAEQSPNLGAAFEKIYQDNYKYGESIWDDMMAIPSYGRFPDVRWNAIEDVRIPFKPVSDPAVRDYLVKNIEEEWHFQNFQLHVDYTLSSSSAVYVSWQPDATPHVPGLGASQIVMNASAPISEYDVQWTIRHEFGHVLGLPDCYIEFYNDDTQSIVGYQLDTTDLMCSRQGHLNQRHVVELQKNYGH